MLGFFFYMKNINQQNTSIIQAMSKSMPDIIKLIKGKKIKNVEYDINTLQDNKIEVKYLIELDNEII